LRYKFCKRRSLIYMIISATLTLAAGSGHSSTVGNTSFVFNIENYSEVWDLPFPCDLGVRVDGTINMRGFPDTVLKKTVRRIKHAVEHGYGFSTNSTIYFAFNKPLHQRHIPVTLTTIQPGSPVFLMDIDPDSPERGRRFPLRLKFQKNKPRLGFGPKNLLSVLPVPGFVLRENTTYAVVIMDTLRDADHKLLNSPPAFKALKRGEVPEGKMGRKAAELYGPMFKFLRTKNVNVDRIAAATVFKTGDPTERMRKMYEAAVAMLPISFSEPLKMTREYDDFYVLEGAVMLPQYQPGEFPYKKDKEGIIVFDGEGKPIVQRRERVPVCLSVPKGKMPSSGWPLMIYIHGTWGISTQHVDRGPVMHDAKNEVAPPGTGPSMILAHRGIATVGAALPGWMERNNNDDMIKYYNFFNIEAIRDNIIQGATEQSMLLRSMTDLKLNSDLCPRTDSSAGYNGKIYFDPNLIFGMGQSLGSIILGPLGAVETEFKVIFPSGSGAHMGNFVARMNPYNHDRLRKKGVGMAESFGVDMFHPIMALSQTVLAPADPGSFMRHIIEDPFPGRKPKHVWLTLGQFDHYFSPEAQNAILIGSGLDFVGEVNDGSTPEILALAGKKPLKYPVSGNIKTKDGVIITGVAMHYEQIGALDGHHINFQRHETKYQYGCFLRSYIDEGVPTLYPPHRPWDSPCGVY